MYSGVGIPEDSVNRLVQPALYTIIVETRLVVLVHAVVPFLLPSHNTYQLNCIDRMEPSSLVYFTHTSSSPTSDMTVGNIAQ